MKTILLAVITAYQRWISPMMRPHCRYEPTCSTYAFEAIQRFGAFRGSRLAIARIARCHPWAPGGIDRVPEATTGTRATPDVRAGIGG
ncbi:MAG TPA: membrane protein insertion efficiency factor YidD [Actinomycetota bacterium]|nr:membrane protein insertion efficiency factor YidD [Actinomycetota bacterium]